MASSSVGSTNVSVHPPRASTIVVRIRFLVKGAGINDMGLGYRLNCEAKFSTVYMHYARKSNILPSKLRLYYRTKLINPEETPFGLGMNENDLVLAYNESGEGVGARPFPSEASRNRLFVVQDFMTLPHIWRMSVSVDNDCASLYKSWAAIHGVPPNCVMLYHNGKPLKANLTVGEAEIHDGDHMYGYVYNP